MNESIEELMYGTGLLRVAGEDRCGFGYFNERLNERQRSILKDKSPKFKVCTEFYATAMNELKNSFRYDKTRDMLAFFKYDGDKFCSNEFYDCDHVRANGYGFTNPWTIDMIESGSICFGTYKIQNGVRAGNFYWNAKKVYELAKSRNELLVTCDTHAYIPQSDAAPSNVSCEIVVGFRKRIDKVKDMVLKCYSGHPVGIEREELKEFILNNTLRKENKVQGFSERLYGEIFKECKPAIEFFVDKKPKNDSDTCRNKGYALPFSNGIEYKAMDDPIAIEEE